MSSFILLALLSFTFFYNSQADLITTICSQANNASSCDNALRSDPRSSGADLRGLGQIIIDKSRVVVRNTNEMANSVSKGKSKGAAHTCVETTRDAIDDLNECEGLLKLTDSFSISTLQVMASSALGNIETCDDEFEGTGEPSSLRKAAQAAEDIVDVLLVIANSL